MGPRTHRAAAGGRRLHRTDIDRLPTTDAVLQPGEGEWFLETPFGALLAAAPGGTLEVPGLPHGLHTLFGVDGRRVRLFADDRGVFTVPMENAPTGLRRNGASSRREAA